MWNFYNWKYNNWNEELTWWQIRNGRMPESVDLKVSQKKTSKPKNWEGEKKLETDQQRPVWWHQTLEGDFNTCIIGVPGGAGSKNGQNIFARLSKYQTWWKLSTDPRTSVNFNQDKHKWEINLDMS